jgi:hypothetical protein
MSKERASKEKEKDIESPNIPIGPKEHVEDVGRRGCGKDAASQEEQG